MYLARPVCDLLLNQRPGEYNSQGFTWASAAQILYHEWWHLAGWQTCVSGCNDSDLAANERLTDCGSFLVLRYALRTYWHLSAKVAQKMYEGAHGNYGPPLYGPLPCALNTVDPTLR